MQAIPRPAFYARARKVLAVHGRLTQAQVDGIEALLGFLEADDAMDLRWGAYLLATVDHECAHTWRPIVERGGATYFASRYGPQTRVGRELGNRTREEAIAFCGRGYVQITGRRNYEHAGRQLGIPLATHPDLALEPAHAYAIAARGMREGWFTGKRLETYLNGVGADWANARRIINGTDRAHQIAQVAMVLHAALRGAVGG